MHSALPIFGFPTINLGVGSFYRHYLLGLVVIRTQSTSGSGETEGPEALDQRGHRRRCPALTGGIHPPKIFAANSFAWHPPKPTARRKLSPNAANSLIPNLPTSHPQTRAGFSYYRRRTVMREKRQRCLGPVLGDANDGVEASQGLESFALCC